MFKKILVPLDGSSLAEQVLPRLRPLVAQPNAQIVLLRVAGHPATSYRVEGLTVNATRSDDNPEHCEAYLQHIAELLRQQGMQVQVKVMQGPIADIIIDYANEAQADLIAMSTHGRTGLGRWLLGSVTDRVVHGTTLPILLFRPEREAEPKPTEEQTTVP